MIGGAVRWLENRTGWITWARSWNQDLPGGVSWLRSLGVALLLTTTLQMITGILLAFYYSPSATDAWASVWFLEHRVALGGLVRGLHYFGASAMVVLLVLHAAQAVLYRAYEAPRELNWITGLLLLGLTTGFLMTGNLLPFDQAGLMQTQVEVNIMASMPGGAMVAELARGGSEIGNATLTRYYALHSFVLPALLLLVMALHVGLRRRHGAAGKPRLTDAQLEEKSAWYFPGQALIDLLMFLVVVGIMTALALTMGAPLEAPADPLASYVARPEWYFLALFQLRAGFEGSMEIVATGIIPALVGGFLLTTPVVAKVVGHRVVAGVFFAGVLGACALTAIPLMEEQNNAQLSQKVASQIEAGALAQRYAGVEGFGIAATGRVRLFEGWKVFTGQRCSDCHQALDDAKDHKAPSLAGFMSRPWLTRFLLNPSHDQHFGKTKLAYNEDEGSGMPAPEASPEDIGALVEFLASLSGQTYDPALDAALVKKGAGLFEDGDCSGCHSLDGEASNAPTLKGYGGMDWLTALLHNPAADNMYGELGDGMPAYDHLSALDQRALLEWLLHLRKETNVR